LPGSSSKGKRIIQDWFNNLPIQSVLDIGPGWGTYSSLYRNSQQLWHAVEINAPYVERFQLFNLYDEIFIEDIRTFILFRHYDVIICGDVLEHMANDEAVEVLDKLFNYADHIIVSIPLDAETNAPPGTGDVDWNNPYELHVGKWSHLLFIDTIQSLKGCVVAFERYPEIAVYLLKRG
jgi:2-polyprenyl-3-methyl-5-hydroxy-6-metoxy-1,4-benzoquinol methylase